MNNITIIPIKKLPEFSPKHDLVDELIKDGNDILKLDISNSDNKNIIEEMEENPRKKKFEAAARKAVALCG